MGVLLVGLLGVAALIPIGKVAITETNKSDRTGMCGRAGIRDVKTRRMLDATAWSSTPTGNTFVLDPLGYAKGLSGTNFGGTASSMQRISLNNVVAEDVFRWQDELTFDSSTNPTSRPRPVVRDSKGNVGPYPSLPSENPQLVAPVTQQSDGHFTWLLTVTASPGEVQAGLTWAQRRQFLVSVTVCWNRLFSNNSTDTTANPADLGEATVSVVCDNATGYGGVGIQYDASKSTVMPKENEWVLLTSTNNNGQASWYRVVSAGTDTVGPPPDPAIKTTRATLVGCDWHGGVGGTAATATAAVSPDDTVKLIVVKGATGVYTTTVQLDDDGIWTK